MTERRVYYGLLTGTRWDFAVRTENTFAVDAIGVSITRAPTLLCRGIVRWGALMFAVGGDHGSSVYYGSPADFTRERSVVVGPTDAVAAALHLGWRGWLLRPWLRRARVELILDGRVLS